MKNKSRQVSAVASMAVATAATFELKQLRARFGS